MLNRIKQYDWKQYNVSLLCVVILLCLISAFSLYLAGGEDKGMAYMKSQIIGMVMGLIIILFLSLMDYHFICRFVGIYYCIGIALTAATYSPLGVTNDTKAARWISLHGITFQPSELMKIILILTLATMFAKNQSKNRQLRYMIPMMLVTAVPVALIVRQPDLSSSLVSVFILVCMIFIAGLSYRILVPIILLGIPIGLVGFWYIQQPGNLIFHNPEDYHYRRIMAWLHPETDVNERVNYQQNRSIRAIASGKLYGKYLQDGGSSTSPRNYNTVSVWESDFIWSVIGEEFGFLGSCLILVLLALVIFKCIMVARKSQDYLGKMIAVGVASMFMFQIFTNISVATLIFPNTGLPLPFLSNGLSSMLSSMIGIGLIMNIAIQPARSSKGGFSMRNVYGSDAERDIDVDLEL